jgi:hypothetical protein
LDFDRIVSELKIERDRIGRAINALLEEVGLASSLTRPSGKAVVPKRGKGITPAGRRRLSKAMKARWAARNSKSPVSSYTAASVAGASAPKKRSGGMTAAGRKRISEAMKKRWAAKRKASSKGRSALKAQA